MRFLLSYLATLLPLALLDGLWLLIVAKSFYAERMSFLFQKSIALAPVAVFYPLYALAVMVLVVQPAVANASWWDAVWRGALFGLAAYGAYDLTNHATIARWPLSVTVVDMLWGACVTALTSFIAWHLVHYFGK